MCSEAGESFLRACFEKDPAKRPSAEDLLDHVWIADRPDAGLSYSADSITRSKSGPHMIAVMLGWL